MKTIRFFLISVFLTSGYLSNIYATREYDCEKIVGNLLMQVSNKIQEDYQLCPIGTIIGMPEWVVGKLGFSLRANKPLTKDELRKKLIKILHLFLQEVNNNEMLRQHLKNYPFNRENIEIHIFVYDEKGYGVLDPKIRVASFNDGFFEYLTKDNVKEFGYCREEKETYEEALKLYQSAKIHDQDEQTK